VKLPILLITPPFTQLNTPYPATPYLKGFLNTQNIESRQMDLGMDVILKLFSKEGIQNIFDSSDKNTSTNFSKNSERISALAPNYIQPLMRLFNFYKTNNRLLLIKFVAEIIYLKLLVLNF
jgi:hypothetical protein